MALIVACSIFVLRDHSSVSRWVNTHRYKKSRSTVHRGLSSSGLGSPSPPSETPVRSPSRTSIRRRTASAATPGELLGGSGIKRRDLACHPGQLAMVAARPGLQHGGQRHEPLPGPDRVQRCYPVDRHRQPTRSPACTQMVERSTAANTPTRPRSPPPHARDGWRPARHGVARYRPRGRSRSGLGGLGPERVRGQVQARGSAPGRPSRPRPWDPRRTGA